MIDLEQIKTRLRKGKTIEQVLEKFDWKEFEAAVAEIFKNNDFKVKQNFRFKTKRRYEIDIIAVRENGVFVVDCKQWSKGRSKVSGLKNAVKEQENRVKELKKFLRKNPIAQSMLAAYATSKFYPLIVTLLQENIVKEGDTFVVPVWKLNSFLLEVENYV